MMFCVLASPALLVSPARPAAVSAGRLTPPMARAPSKEARSRKRSEVSSWYDSGARLTVENPTPVAKPMASVASQGGLAGWWDALISRSPSFGGKNQMCTNIEVPAEDPVTSWYDAGARLAVEVPAPAPAPAPAPTPAPAPVAPVVSWFDKGIRLAVEEPAPAPKAAQARPVAPGAGAGSGADAGFMMGGGAESRPVARRAAARRAAADDDDDDDDIWVSGGF